MTYGLFFAMQALIHADAFVADESAQRWQLGFVRVKREEPVQRKQREKPKPLQQSSEPPPSAPVIKQGRFRSLKRVTKVALPEYNPSFSLGDGPYIGAGADTDVVPLVRVNPQYPMRAQIREIEGWVHIRFEVTPQGTTTGIEVLDADPEGYFENAAINAVKKYKYKPRMEGGVPVSRAGVEVVLSFEISK